MQKNIIIKSRSNNTKIIIKSNYIYKYLVNLLRNNNKIFCIVDYKMKYILKDLIHKKNINVIYLRSGENIKNIQTYFKVADKLLRNKIDRNSILISIGGGTLGDLCGFISSTILRGINYILIPTTLLSQVDSSIGGKNGINTRSGKNLLGTFFHPSVVLIDASVLKSLPIRELKAGYSEIIKHALIKDREFFKWLDKNIIEILNFNYKVIEKAILKSINIKLYYVKKDPEENLINDKSRSMLNFGHTFGHALESFYKYQKSINHGEAISIGMITECKIAAKLGFLSETELNIILDHFKKAGLKIIDKNINNKKIYEYILNDKKSSNNKINIVLLKNIGKSFFFRNVEINKIKRISKYLI